MNHIPLVHILLPVFNHKKYLLESISSVLSQSYQNIKLIILNDGSTENLDEILDPFRNSDKICICSQNNQGLPATLTELYKKSLNSSPFPRYITWHSADNFYFEDAIEKLVTFLEINPDCDLVYSNVRIVDSDGNPSINSNYRKDDQTELDSSILNLDYDFESICDLSDNFVNACFLIRSKIELMLPEFDSNSRGFEDYIHLLQLRIIAKGAHLGIKEPLYNYRLHDETLTSKIDGNKLASSQESFVSKTKFIVNGLLRDKFLFKLTSDSIGRFGSVKCESTKQLIEEIKYHLNDSNLCIGTKHTPPLSGTISKNKCSEIQITKVHEFLHSSHNSLFEIPPLHFLIKNADSVDKKDLLFTGISELPKVLTRARNRNLKMFENETNYTRSLLLFPPSSKDERIIKYISEFIARCEEILVVLFCQSKIEKEVADEIYLKSNCSMNLRIVEERRDSAGLLEDQNILLNCLGSIHNILSITNFLPEDLNTNEFFCADLVAEFVLANLVGRKLLVPLNFLDKRDYQFLTSPLVVGSNLESQNNWGNSKFLEKTDLEICDKALVQFSYPDSFNQVINASFCYLI